MSTPVRLTKNGIVCNTEQTLVHLDPKITSTDGVNFVSHAHMDHLPTVNGGVILSSNETCDIADLRGFHMKDQVDSLDDFTMIKSGHILGSTGLLFDDIFYTGDLTTRDRGYLKGAKVPKCKTLITECTFGLPEFVFPSISEIQSRVNEIISELYSKGIPVILQGYELGKAQTISQLFDNWDPLYYHDSVKKMNDLHRTLGMPLKDGMSHSVAEAKGLLSKKPWVMVTPMMSEKNSFIKKMKTKYGAVTVGFSGWAKSPRFSFGRRADHSIPLSDHCDFSELVDMVVDSGAEKIYTIHGFVDEFAAHLTKMGFDAQPLREGSLDNFV